MKRITTKIYLMKFFNLSEIENAYWDYLNFQITGQYNDTIEEEYSNQKILKQDGKIFLNLGYNYNFNPQKKLSKNILNKLINTSSIILN